MFIFYLLLSAFILHFIKLLFEPYKSTMPTSISSITFENICAVNTILFPWVYLSKNKVIKDYMIVVSVIGGLGSCLIPYRTVGFEKVTFDIIRFYYDHFILFLAPFLMIYTKQYHLSLKRIFIVPFILYGVAVLILANEFVLVALGIIEGNMDTMLDPTERNAALIFGPNPGMKKFDWVYNPFVFDIFKTIPFGPNAGKQMYWPIIWFLIPAYIYTVLFGAMINYVFNFISNKIYVTKENLAKLKEIDLRTSDFLERRAE